jgi:cold shock CspA family protein
VFAVRGQTGVVKWFSVRDGYGFIARDGASEDESELFVHRVC